MFLDIGFCQWGFINLSYPKAKILMWFLSDKLIFTKTPNQFVVLYSKYKIIINL